MLVLGEQGDAVDVFHRQHRIGKAALVPGRGGALLALDRIGIDVVAREAVFGRDEVGGNALRHEIGSQRDLRIDRPGAAGGADADAAHGFDAAADRHLMLPGHDLGRGKIDRIETGRAEAVDLHARHAVAIAGAKRRRARDVAARLADRIDATHDHVIDQRRVELVALADGGERCRREVRASRPRARRRRPCRARAACGHDRKCMRRASVSPACSLSPLAGRGSG